MVHRRTVLRGSLAAVVSAGSLSLAQSAAFARGGAHSWVESTLAGMTLQEKVGQLFVTYAYGPTAHTADPRNRSWLGTDTAAQAIERYHLGGIIYFTWSDNLNDPRQVAGLSNGLQRAALAHSDIPLFITTDQEHGIVQRLGPPVTQFPGSMALGANGTLHDARKAAKISGKELRAVGINTNHAPVADVNVNPANPVIGIRSFGSDPQRVAELTAAQVKGYQYGSQGTISTVKHFPGHGDTDTDSHSDLPRITHTKEEWDRIDAPPFKAAIAAGVGIIMSGHLTFPELDPSGDPATLSGPIMTGLLRRELGYDGVVITDSMGMAAVRQKYGDAEAAVRAIEAGVDIVLMTQTLAESYRTMLDAVGSGRLTEERIDTSVRRILALKYERGLVGDPFADVDAVDDVIGTREHLDIAQHITDRSTTVVKNDGGLLPVAADGQSVLVTGWGSSTTANLTEILGGHGVTATRHYTGTDPDAAAIDAAVAEAAHHDLVVVLTSDAAANAGQVALIDALEATGKPVITVAANKPYDIAAYPDVATHLVTYSYRPVALEAAARVILGETRPRGTLPVDIPSADDPDETLYPLGHGLSFHR